MQNKPDILQPALGRSWQLASACMGVRRVEPLASLDVFVMEEERETNPKSAADMVRTTARNSDSDKNACSRL